MQQPRQEVERRYAWKCTKCGGDALFSAIEYESEHPTRDLSCPGCGYAAHVPGVSRRLPVVHLALATGWRDRAACGARSYRVKLSKRGSQVTCRACRRSLPGGRS